MASVLSRAVPPLPDPVFRDRLSAIRDRLHELEGRCPPGHAAVLADVLDALEDELISLGCPA